MRAAVFGATWLALLSIGAVAADPGTAEAAPAKKKAVCTEKRVPVTYCIMTHRGRLDCTGKVYRYDQVCK
ncbi:MAG: hypothetical protein WDN31_20620 [Hyphomicrobium sp.]